MRLTTAARIFVLPAFLIVGCDGSPPRQARPAAGTPDGSATSLDWEGRYRGVLPCADCEGIETTVTLGKDGAYRLETRYLGTSVEVFDQKGAFAWDPAGTVIVLEGLRDRPNRYLVGENYLVQLDMAGKRIIGPLADCYRLPKIDQARRSEHGAAE